jgi:TPR repeat protein
MDDDSRLAEARALLRGDAGVPPNPERAAALLHAAADGGDPAAMLRCAVFAAGGIGQPQDWALALDLLRRAADAGNASAQAQFRLLGVGSGSVDLAGLFSPRPLEPLSQEATR